MAAESARSGQGRRGRARHGRAAAAVMMILLPAVLVLSALRTAVRLRQVAVAVMVACLATAPMPLASAHDPLTLSAAEEARHAALVAQEIAEHGHSHDDGEADEQTTGHMHGHDPADHSHQFAFLAASSSQWGLPSSERWPPARSGPPAPATGSGIDRPPKPVSSL